ncbi:MAG: hypothetical protein KAI66_10845 [Lentisphaeria bacterium]|nr:hypothetical protein [Lentisphaeria bacterium]
MNRRGAWLQTRICVASLALLLAGSGCAWRTVALQWTVLDNAGLHRRLMDNLNPPERFQATYRSLISFGKRRFSITEVITCDTAGVVTLRGVGDMGGVLYAAEVGGDGTLVVKTLRLPMPKRVFRDIMARDVLRLWLTPLSDPSRLVRLPDRTKALVFERGRYWELYLFDGADRWSGYRLLKGGTMRAECRVRWDGRAMPAELHSTSARHDYAASRRLIDLCR